MAEVSSHHVITPVSANCHPLWPISLVRVAESYNNAGLPVSCPKLAWSSVTPSESKIILDFPSPTATSLWHILCPAWTENSAQKQILVMFWSMMVREPGLMLALTLVPTMLLYMHDLLYFLTTLGNQKQAGKFSWLLPKGIWYHLEQGRRGYAGKGLLEVMLMVICSHKAQMKSMPHLSQLPGTQSYGKYKGSLQVFVLGLRCFYILWKQNMGEHHESQVQTLSQIFIRLVIEGQRGRGPNMHHRNALRMSLGSWFILWLWTKYKSLCFSVVPSVKGE